MKKIIIVCFLIIGISFLIIESLVISELRTNDSKIADADYVVVLGAGLKGSALSLTLKQRLDTCLNYLNSNKDIPVIVSGGQGPGEDIPEAEAMKNYLMSKGITEARIVPESISTSTQENLLFTKKILDNKGIIKPRIIIVTSDFHMYRAKMIANNIGFVTYGISSKSPAHLKMYYMIREYFAMIKWVISL